MTTACREVHSRQTHADAASGIHVSDPGCVVDRQPESQACYLDFDPRESKDYPVGAGACQLTAQYMSFPVDHPG